MPRSAQTWYGQIIYWQQQASSIALRVKAQLAIGPLEAAIKALRPSPNSLTPLHADFVKVCLLSHNYEAALTLVQDDILDVDPSVCIGIGCFFFFPPFRNACNR